MTAKSPQMKSMFGGKPKGGFFDLPLLTPGDIADADIILMGVPAATPYTSVGSYCADAPAVIGPAPGGFSYWQLLDILEAASKRARICGFNLVELMPGGDIGGRGALVAARIVAIMLGLIARQETGNS